MLRKVLSLSDEKFESVRFQWESLITKLCETSDEALYCFQTLQDASEERCQVT